MPPRIAIPMPHSSDLEYAERSIPQYERAVEQAGGEPVRIPLDQTPAEVMKIIERCDGVLLPGSPADLDPAKFNAPRSRHTAATDPRRDTVDELLLQDAYNMHKPILGICYGLQSLNVYRSGSLIQHIPDFLPEELRTKVDHEAGKNVAVAHEVEIAKDAKLAEIMSGEEPESLEEAAAEPRQNAANGASLVLTITVDTAPAGRKKNLVVPVNSSHHQSAEIIGDGLRVSARCTADNIIEAVEGISPDHFVLAVQWHPERSIDADAASRAIFKALINAAAERHEELAGEFESVK
jgi:putative glutamine amidotransferase